MNRFPFFGYANLGVLAPPGRPRRRNRPRPSISSGLLQSIGRPISMAVVVIALTLGMAQNARAEEHVVTIWFGGTGLAEGAWANGVSRWNTPSLMAEMHWGQVVEGPYEHKLFVPGVGSVPECSIELITLEIPQGILSEWFKFPPFPIGIDLIQQGMPHTTLCRNWERTVEDAELFLDGIMSSLQPQDEVRLNLVGHSRGAVAAIWFLHRLVEKDTEERVTTINLVALDPVPGMDLVKDDFEPVETISWEAFTLDERLDRFIGIFVVDERSSKFGAIIPDAESEDTEFQLYQIRGAHQTIVGNLRKYGHTPQLYPLPEDGYDDPLAHLKHVHDVTGMLIHELLISPEWGSVEFINDDCLLSSLFTEDYVSGSGECEGDSSDWDSEELRYQAFEAKVEAMGVDDAYDHRYLRMRESGYFGRFLETMVSEDGVIRCREVKDGIIWDDEEIGLPHLRCVVRVNGKGFYGCETGSIDNKHAICELEIQNDIPLIGYSPYWPVQASAELVWLRLQDFLYADDDEDSVLNHLDNCPETYNPGQADCDLDGTGDLCDPDYPCNHPPDCSGAAIAGRVCDAFCQAHISGADVTGVTDPDGDPLSISVDPNTLMLGMNFVEVTATDSEDSCETVVSVNVTDETLPAIDCPADIAAESTSPTGATVDYLAPEGTDNCVGATTVQTSGLGPGALFPIGLTAETWTVTDGSGNGSSCTFMVRVLAPREIIGDLIGRLNDMFTNGIFTGQEISALVNHLAAAIDMLDAAPTLQPACAQLDFFIKAVQKHVNTGTLTEAESKGLQDSALNAGRAAGCSGSSF
jgi:hypothetical protein